MRRNARRNCGDENPDFKKVLYISGSILSVAIIGFVTTFFIYNNKINEEAKIGKLNTSIVDSYSENTEQASSPMGKTVNEVESQNQISENTIDNSIEENSEITNTTKYAVNTSHIEEKKIQSTQAQPKSESEIKIEKEKIKDPEFKMPVEGEIMREFAKDKLTYSNTLEEWVTHNGIDIKAEKTTVVKASAPGCIKSIKNDPRYGLTVVIEHVNGFTSVYSNLLTAEFVVVGENVKEGQTIGTVGNTATFEIVDEPHLHFEILKNGENLDPELYIKN